MFFSLLFLGVCVASISAEIDFSGEFFQGRDSKRYLVLMVHRLGLANRLRTIADWYTLARLSDRTLLVSWKPAVDCNIQFTDLYEGGPPEFFLMGEPLPDEDAGLQLLEQIAIRHNVSHRILYDETKIWAKSSTSFVLAREMVMSQHQMVATKYDGVLTLEDLPCQYYSHSHRHFLQSLKPKEQYTKTVNEIMASYFEGALPVAVHMRFHDPQQDWEIVPPLEGEGRAKAFGEGASVEDFAKVMRKIEGNFVTLTAEQEIVTLVRFFVASNHQPSKTELLKYFPSAISITLQGEAVQEGTGLADRHTFAGMEHAFLEFLLLMRMSLVINTYSSTFAVEAARAMDTPLLGVWNGNYVLSHHLALPYCGNLQYAKSFHKDLLVGKFTEGTNDQRVVTGAMIPLVRCPYLINWGLGEDVHCAAYSLIPNPAQST